MVYQGATGLYHFLINVIPFISNSEVTQYNNTIHDNYKRIIVLYTHLSR